MIFLTATTETLTLVTAAALSLDWAAGYVDIDSTTGATPGSAQGNVVTATTTTVASAPAANAQRQLKSFIAVNKDAALTQTVTLNKVTSAGTFALARNVSLAPNETLIWVDTIGFEILDAFGVHKVANALVNLGTGVTGTLPAQFGGTGISSYAVGDILYASGATALSALPGVAAGNALISGGAATAPAWGKIALTTHVSGTLPVANGGTGITSLGAGVATWLGTPSSANLLAAVTGETGTDALVFANTPTLVTPVIGAATGTSVNLTSTATASAFIPTGSSIPANGLYLPAANTLALSTASAEQVRVNTTGVGIGAAPGNKLTVSAAGTNGANTDIVSVENNNATPTTDTATGLLFKGKSNAGVVALGRVSVGLASGGAGTETSYMTFSTATAGALTEKMRVNSAGDVGIGVTPSAVFGSRRVLHVSDSTNGVDLRLTGTSGEVSMTSSGGTFYMSAAATTAANSHIVFSNGGTTFAGAVERMRLDSSGNVLIGTTTTTGNAGIQLLPSAGSCVQSINHVSGTASGTGYEFFNYNGTAIGSITQSGTTAVAFNTTSDRRLKINIADAPEAGDVIDAIRVRAFNWKFAPNEHVTYGFIAQELATVAPQAVTPGDDSGSIMTAWAVDQSKLVPLLLKGIQELRARVAVLEG